MKRLVFYILLIAGLFCIWLGVPLQAQVIDKIPHIGTSDGRPEYIPGQLLVKFHSQIPLEQINRINIANKVNVISYNSTLGIYLMV